MMNTEIELKNYIICEFLIHGKGLKQLLETRGVVNDIDYIVEYFSNMVENQIKNAFLKKETIIKTYKNSVLNPIKTFFKKFELTLTVNPYTKKSYSGSLDTNSFKQNKNTWEIKPILTFTIGGENIYECSEVFATAIGHEITHAWNLYQYAIKNNSSPVDNVNNKRE